ncbi:hypothetical protein GCM10022381_39510 [Leifsonia kafniensis]|uniref:DUF2127 domain-containing protein n=1 Tax=Leifsonia kafniensis TaxID=475957 RepID=A0ABP7L674_9MICO
MDAASTSRRTARNRRLELVYRIGLVLKGVDGLLEVVAGLLLWFAPGMLRSLLAPLEQVDADDRSVRVFVAHVAGRFDSDLAQGPPVFVIFFLLSHGVVKLVLVYCLLKEYRWVYPYALGVLGLFALYQLFALVRSPSVGLALLMVLDLLIIWLIWREWGALRRASTERPLADTPEAR